MSTPAMDDAMAALLWVIVALLGVGGVAAIAVALHIYWRETR